MSTTSSTSDDMDDRHKVSISIPFESPEKAQLALKVISVDKILRSDSVSRELRTSDNCLVAQFEAVSIRQARVALDHFFSDVQLVAQTIDEFDPAKSAQGTAANGSQDDAAKEVEVGAT